MDYHNDGYVHETYIDGGTTEPPKKEILDKKENFTPGSVDQSMQRSILKNVIIISFAFMLNFTGFNGVINLQSSINQKLGTDSIWVIYVSLVVSCAFLPSWMIKKLKAKWTLPICIFLYSTYIAAQFYPTYYTFIPTALLLGLGAAPMWSAKCLYLTQVGEIYGGIVGENSEVIITRFFGIFFLVFQSSQVWGNLISSTVLSTGVDNITRSEEHLDKCGVNFCPEFDDILPKKNSVIYSKIVTMTSIYLGFSLLSVVIIALLVDPLSKFGADETAVSSKSAKKLLVASFSHMQNINQILIIPLTMWSGLEQSFIASDFTSAFVTCGLGIHMIGYVMLTYGVCDAICSMTFSPVVKRFGRVPIFTFGAIVNVVLLILLNMWRPNPDQIVVFFLVASLWGVADAIWQTQINAFYGVIFPGKSEAAFSNYRLWESIGFIIVFVWGPRICLKSKIYFLYGFLAVGMLGYYIIEFIEKIGGIKRKDQTITKITEFVKH